MATNRTAVATASAGLLAACLVNIDDDLVSRASRDSEGGESGNNIEAGDGGLEASREALEASVEAGRPLDAGIGDGCAHRNPPARTGEAPCPSDMASIAKPNGGTYCMDRTEVTVGAYQAFMAARVPLCAQPPACAFNGTYLPGGWATDGAPPTGAAYPVGTVNWCGAYVYCWWMGKRLCAAIDGGSIPYFGNDFADPERDEWFRACSNGGATLYPYGDAYAPNACVGSDHPIVGPLPVAQPVSCTGNVPVINLSGNVMEWEDACGGRDPGICDAGGPECDFCHTRGGSFQRSGVTMACASNESIPRGQGYTELGFRCCAD